MSNAAELRKKDTAALEAEIKELQRTHFALRMQKGTQQLSSSAMLGQTRRAISRAKTILTEQQRASAATTA